MTTDPRANGTERAADPIDVDALMADIRRRVAEKKARGLYSVDALAAAAVDETGPLGADELERLRDLAVQRVDLSTTASTKPVLGPLVGQVKRRLTRAVSQPLYAMAAHASTFNAGLIGYAARLGREAAALRRDLDATRAEAGATAARAEGLERALADTEARLATAEEIVARLRAEGLHERLARLEHAAPPTARAPVAVPEDAPPTEGLLGLIIEARDWSDADADRWAALLAGSTGPVLHVGCGSGRGLAALGSQATGVDEDPEVVAAGVREGRPVVCADPVAHAAALEPGTLGGALVTGVVERLGATRIDALTRALARALADGAPLVIEGMDPGDLSVLAGEVWRDPRRLRALHPDAVVALVEAAGLGVARVERDAGRYAVHAAA